MAIEFDVAVKLEQLRQDLAKIPGITEKEAKKMADAVGRGARKAGQEAEREYERHLKAMEKAADKFTGGAVGDFMDVAEGVGALGPVAGTAAIGIAGIGLAAGAAVVGLVGIERAGQASLETLEKLEGRGLRLVSADQVSAIGEANAALDLLGTVAEMAVVALASDLGPAIETVSIKAAEGALSVLDLYDSWSSTHDLVEEVAVFFGGSLVEAVAAPISGLVTLASALQYVAELAGAPAQTTLADRYDDWADSIARDTLGLGDLTAGLDDAGAAAANADPRIQALLDRLAEAHYSQVFTGPELPTAVSRTNDLAAATRAAEAARRQDEAAAKAWLEQQAKANAVTEKSAKLLDSYTSDQLSATARIDAAFGERLEQIAEVERAGEAADQVSALIAAAEERRVRDLTALQVAEIAKVQAAQDQAMSAQESAVKAGSDRLQAEIEKSISAIGDLVDTATSAVIARQQDAAAQLADQRDAEVEAARTMADRHLERIDAAEEAGKLTASAAEKERRAVKASVEEQSRQIVDGYNSQIDAAEKAAMAAYRVAQASAIVQVAIASALNYVELVGAFAYLGPFAPAAAAAVTVPVAAAAVATIAGTPPPEFPSGGLVSPDHVVIAAEPGEGVVSRRGMQQLGPDGLRQLNAGGSAGGGPAVLQVRWGPRILDEVVAETYQRGGRFARAVDLPRGRMPGHAPYRGA